VRVVETARLACAARLLRRGRPAHGRQRQAA